MDNATLFSVLFLMACLIKYAIEIAILITEVYFSNDFEQKIIKKNPNFDDGTETEYFTIV